MNPQTKTACSELVTLGSRKQDNCFLKKKTATEIFEHAIRHAAHTFRNFEITVKLFATKAYSMSLEEYREQIDSVNREIAEKIAERMEIVEKVGEYKKENDMEIKDEGREEVVKQQFEDIFEKEGLPRERGRDLAELLIGMAVEEEEEVKEQ